MKIIEGVSHTPVPLRYTTGERHATHNFVFTTKLTKKCAECGNYNQIKPPYFLLGGFLFAYGLPQK